MNASLNDQNQPKRTEKYIQPFPVGSSLYQITRGKNKGKWTVWGMEGVQNSLKRFADIPFYVVKWTHIAKTTNDPEGIIYISLRPFNTKEEAEEWVSDICKDEVEISEWILTADQIVK